MADAALSQEIPDNLRLLTIREVMAATSLGKSTIYALMASGRLRKTKIAGATRVRLSDLRDFIEASAAA